MKKNIKKAKDGVTSVTKYLSKRSDSYPTEKKVEYDTTGYSAGRKMFPGKMTETYSSGKTNVTRLTGDRKSVDKAINNPVNYEGRRSDFPKVATIKSKPSKGNQDYRLYSESEIDNYTPTSREPEKRRAAPSTPAKTDEKKGGGGGDGGGRSTAATTTSRANTPTSSKPGLRAKVPVSSSKVSSTLEVPKRETVDVTYKPKARNYSDTEKKVLALTDKGGVGGKDLTESERMKLKSLQAKRASEKMKAERQGNRAEKKQISTEKKSNKAAQKATMKMAEKRSERKSNRAVNKTISRISKVNNKPKK